MKSNSTMKKHIGKTDPGDRFSCALCGDRQIHSGIIFKGHCICGKCVAYIYSGTLAGDGKNEVMTVEPGQIRSFRTPAAEIPDAESWAAESRDRYGAETEPGRPADPAEESPSEKNGEKKNENGTSPPS